MPLNLGDGVAWLEAQPPDSLDGVFTDPPWGVGPKFHGQDQWKTLIRRVITAAATVVRPHGHIMLWVGQREFDPLLRWVIGPLLMNAQAGTAQERLPLYWNAFLPVDIPHVMYKKYKRLDGLFVLGRTLHAPPRGVPYCHPIYVAPQANEKDNGWMREHPACRPVRVVGALLRDWFAPGDVICDPFAGSDTTGWQSERLGLTCWSWEISPKMKAIADQRHAQNDLFADWNRDPAAESMGRG